jgi:prolyl oligopeptidase
VAAENALTDSYYATIQWRRSLHDKIEALERVDTYGPPRSRGGHVFIPHRSTTQDQFALLTSSSADAAPDVLLDPNALSPDGRLAWHGWAVTSDGATLAYGLADGGGDWTSWHLRDVATKRDLPDVLEHAKYYRVSFTRDGKGLYYSRFPAPPAGKELSEPDHDCKVYYHAIGTPPAADRVVYERPEHPTWQFEPTVTEDGRWLVIEIGDGEVGDRNVEQVALLDLSTPGAKPVALVDAYEEEYRFAGSAGSTLFFQTSKDAPKKRVVAVDARSASHPTWKEIVPEGLNAIDSVTTVGGQLFVATLTDAHSAITAYDVHGKKLRDVELPGIGTANGFNGLSRDTETFYLFTSFTTPLSVYRYDVKTGKSTLWRSAQVPTGRPSLETTQVFYPGKDGTKIPMFLTSRKGLEGGTPRPTLLYGYGGFGISITPFFWPAMAAWVEAGGTFAVANIRGGGEYGQAWHRAAVKTKKQVSYDDFMGAAEFLVASGRTTRDQLGAFGISGGGVMIGVVLTERPELFGAVATLAGPHDLVRFPLFGEGAGWQDDFGSPDVPEELRALLAISPVHNARQGTHYPPTLLVTADHDVRVAPLHSYKFAAALQWAQAGDAPVLLRVETTSGHGGGTTASSQVDQDTELLAFFGKTLGLDLGAAK